MVIEKLKKNIPWWLKIILKIVLSRLPINYQKWSLLNLFKHGYPENKFLYVEKFTKHYNLAFPDNKPNKFVCLELGPGDSIATGIIANAFGATKTYLIDVGNFAIQDINYYKEFSKELIENDIQTPDISSINSFEELLSRFNIIYLKRGLQSFAQIADSSVDMIFSHSAIEHVRLKELPDIVAEMSRVISSDGVMSHNIDLMDHLNYSLNNLRFSEKRWESDFFAKSGFYTNRLRYSQIIKYFENNDFVITYQDNGKWLDYPIDLKKINNEFAHLSGEDLLIRTMHIVGRKKT